MRSSRKYGGRNPNNYSLGKFRLAAVLQLSKLKVLCGALQSLPRYPSSVCSSSVHTRARADFRGCLALVKRVYYAALAGRRMVQVKARVGSLRPDVSRRHGPRSSHRQVIEQKTAHRHDGAY